MITLDLARSLPAGGGVFFESYANTANSLNAGLAEACVTRTRRRVDVTGCGSLISRPEPMLVACASATQAPAFQASTATASIRCPNRLASRRRITLNVEIGRAS